MLVIKDKRKTNLGLNLRVLLGNTTKEKCHCPILLNEFFPYPSTGYKAHLSIVNHSLRAPGYQQILGEGGGSSGLVVFFRFQQYSREEVVMSGKLEVLEWDVSSR